MDLATGAAILAGDCQVSGRFRPRNIPLTSCGQRYLPVPVCAGGQGVALNPACIRFGSDADAGLCLCW